MFVEVSNVYQGKLYVENIHHPSSAKMVTTAPQDNGGTGDQFSPTDLLATSLGACMLTVMGIVAERNGLDIKGARCTTKKFMNSDPRRVRRLESVISVPAAKLSEGDRKKLELAAKACPVKQSLHPEIELDIKFEWEL